MKIIPLVHIRNRNVNFEKFVEKGYYEIYMVDEGEDLNLKLYEDIAGVFKLWIEPCRTFLDVVDVIVSGAYYAVVTEEISLPHLRESLKATDKIAFRYKGNDEKLRFFLNMGGNTVISDDIDFLRELRVKNKVLISERIMDLEDMYGLIVPYEVIGVD